MWEATRIPNLFTLDGRYYGRVKVKGKSLRKSFDTSSLAVARAKLRDWLLNMAIVKDAPGGTFGGMIEPYRGWLEGQKINEDIGQSTIDYKLELIDAIRKTWPGFDQRKLETLTADILRDWRVDHRAKYSATRTNGAITVIREIIDLAVVKGTMSPEASANVLPGLRFAKVKYDYKRMNLQLPEAEKLLELRNEIYRRCQVQGSFGGWLFDFILFSGCRIDSANHICWEDVRWGEGTGKVYFRTAKYGPYDIPLFPQLRTLLERIKATTPGKPEDLILPSKSLHTALTSACKALGISHLTHHDLRHIFATRCIEAGTDIPTVAAWLGHKDGGRTAMLIYGHLRQKHSQAQAALMDFLPGGKV